MAKLTERAIAAMAVPAGKRDMLLFDAECPGLGVRVTASGGRTFLHQWRDPATRQSRRQPLGTWPALTLAAAREAVRTRAGKLAQGIDLDAERNAKRAKAEAEKAERALTFRALIENWRALHLAGKRPGYAREAVRALHFAFADVLDLPATRISKPDVLGRLDALVKGGRAPMAARTAAYGGACYSWAVRRGTVPESPFAGLPRIAGGNPERDRVLTDAETAAIWRAAGSMPYPFGPLVCLLMLTLQRREEVAGMRWSELAPDLGRWTIPAARMKRGIAHEVALPETAREILARLPRREGCDFVFTTTGRTAISGFSRAKRALDLAAGLDDWRFHDFRRTGVSWLAGAGFNPVVADRLLAHRASSLHGAAKVYQRHDFAAERARALEAWADHVLAVADGREADPARVVPLRA